MLVTAESCTGGWVAQVVTSVAGSSDWFERGFVTYSNDSKHELLGVSQSTLKKHGAVSEETAREMARGALAHSKGTSRWRLPRRGPRRGSPEKPVGMVLCLGSRKRPEKETRHFSGDRGACGGSR